MGAYRCNASANPLSANPFTYLLANCGVIFGFNDLGRYSKYAPAISVLKRPARC